MALANTVQHTYVFRFSYISDTTKSCVTQRKTKKKKKRRFVHVELWHLLSTQSDLSTTQMQNTTWTSFRVCVFYYYRREDPKMMRIFFTEVKGL